ncbi:MAG TPA: ABC transporter ATP-binding protein [Clostridiaceae bacterium]|nr:ABC transporter ATP-binding protein [Clostridiaceae bacterium]
MKPVIEIKDLDVFYGNVKALSGINLTIDEKEFLCIAGPNGGGKSTLLKVILGLVMPSYGTVKVFGKTPEEVRNTVGYVPQFSKFDKGFPISVADVVLMGCLSSRKELFHRYSRQEREKVENIMNELGIHDLKHRQIGQLSGGQLQRVLIARALAVDPKIMLLDEPTASVDADSKEQIYKILNRLNDKMTIIIVTHDIEAVSPYIKSIAYLNVELYYHGEARPDSNAINKFCGYPVGFVAHASPYHVLNRHQEG